MLTLRQATKDDLPLLQLWEEQEHVKLATGADAELDHDWLAEWFPPLQGWIEMLIAEVDGRPVGVVQVIDPAVDETHYWGDIGPGFHAIDIWLGDIADTGKGYGSAMMRQVIARSFANEGVHAILLDPLASNIRSHRFYERLGFIKTERRNFGEDDCFIYRLDRVNASLRGA